MQETTAQYLDRLRIKLSYERDAFWELHTMVEGWKSRYLYYMEKARLHAQPITYLKEDP